MHFCLCLSVCLSVRPSVLPSVCPSQNWISPCLVPIWQLMTAYDNSWQLMTAYDSLWQLMTAYDSWWQLMTAFDSFWQLLTTFDYFWLLLTTHDKKNQFYGSTDRLLVVHCMFCILSSSQDLVVVLVFSRQVEGTIFILTLWVFIWDPSFMIKS